MIVKLRLLFVGMALFPVALLLISTQNNMMIGDRMLNQQLAFALAVSLLIALYAPGLAVRWLLGNRIEQMRALCANVKQGQYRGLLELPYESRDEGDEEELTLLMRDMNWMARQIEIRERDLKESHGRLEAMAMTDPLTDLANRRRFFDVLQCHAKPEGCDDRLLSMLIIDVDHFKKINDVYGHQSGDQVLRELARIIVENTRCTDLAARIGGEEYGLLMPGASQQAATETARRIQHAIGMHDFCMGNGLSIRATVSIGLCTVRGCPCRIDQDQLFHCTDQALYFSKNHGRNSISVFNVDSRTVQQVA